MQQMKLKICILSLMLMSATGCAQIAEKGAMANDEAVSTAIWTICHGASIGSIRRQFSGNFNIWKVLCNGEIDIE